MEHTDNRDTEVVDVGAEWLNAWATVGALLAAVGAGFAGWMVYRIEADRDRTSAEVAAASQAREVSSWAAVTLTEETIKKSGVVVMNASRSPVYEVSIRLIDQRGDRSRLRLHVLPPGSFFTARGGKYAGWFLPDFLDSLSGTLRPVMMSDKWRVTELTFRDTANNYWRRDALGKLDGPIARPSSNPLGQASSRGSIEATRPDMS